MSPFILCPSHLLSSASVPYHSCLIELCYVVAYDLASILVFLYNIVFLVKLFHRLSLVLLGEILGM